MKKDVFKIFDPSLLPAAAVRSGGADRYVQKQIRRLLFRGRRCRVRIRPPVYEATLRASDSTGVDFADLGILEVAITGTFNNWTKEGWTMQQVDQYRYRLRKPLREFTDAPNWQFKFVINGSYWTATDSVLKNRACWAGTISKIPTRRRRLQPIRAMYCSGSKAMQAAKRSS